MEFYKIFRQSTGVSIDSRQIKPGNIFVALKGENFDGHQYVRKALKDGALMTVIDNPDFFIAEDKTYLVDNTLIFLQTLANFHRRKLAIPILAITGTNGKTTTKELCYAVLSEKLQVQATKGNLNNHIGVPLSLLSLHEGTEIGIIEMGANHRGEIEALCRIAEPTLGIITNIGKAHLEGFGSFEGVLKTKKELFDYLVKKNADIIFYNSDDKYLSTIIPLSLRHISYGTAKADIIGKINSGGITINMEWKRKEKSYWNLVNTQLVGDYNLSNILAAVSLGLYFNVARLSIQKAISEYKPSNQRSQIIQHQKNKIILDAYNANPVSMAKALSNFIKIKSKLHKTAILGDMYELGSYAAEEHQIIINLALETSAIHFIFIGKEFFRYRNPSFLFFENKNDFLSHSNKQSFDNELILIKGSRGMKLEEIIEYL